MKILKVGDKVKIKQDLVLGEFYNHCGYHAPMEKYAGKVATITNVFQDSETEVNYNLDIDKGKWFWDSEMLISAEEDKSYNNEGRMGMLNHKHKTFSEEVVREMLSKPIVTTLQDVVVESVNKKLEEETVRLAKAVCEYEEIVHKLEQELEECKRVHRQEYNSLVDDYNELLNDYNSLVDDFNEVLEDYKRMF